MIRPKAFGGYVFPGGALRVAGNAGSIEAIHFSDRCAAGATTPPVALDRQGVFRYAGRLSNSVSVILVGRFLDPNHADLRIQFKGALCAKQPLHVTARLS